MGDPGTTYQRTLPTGSEASGIPLAFSYAVCVVAVVALVVALEVGGGAPHEPPTGIAGPGGPTGWGVPGTRLLSNVAGAVMVGAVLASTTLVPGNQPRLRHRFLRYACLAALVVALSAAAGLVFNASELLGQPVSAVLGDPGAATGTLDSTVGKALGVQLLLALGVAVATRLDRVSDSSGAGSGHLFAAAVLIVATAAFAAPTVAGHAAIGADRGLASFAVLVHAAAASLWVGGLVALALMARLVPGDTAASFVVVAPVRRFSVLALGCFVAVAVSGLVNAWVRLGAVSELWRTDYGRLVLAKAVALALLAGIGWAHRRYTIPGLEAAATDDATGPRRQFVRLAGVEIAVMAATFGIAVGLAHSPTPGGAQLAGAHSAGADHAGMADMDDMDLSRLNEPDATPANELAGVDLESGVFMVLDTAPPNSEAVSGQAWLAQDESGTTVTVRLRGLVPGDTYLAHLHEQPCGRDAGGDHFAFDPDGPEAPPNEVHLGFVASADGSGQASVTNDRRVGDGARAIVVHPAAAMDNRLACADF